VKYTVLSHTLTETEQRLTVLICDDKGFPRVGADGSPVWARFVYARSADPTACLADLKAQLDAKYAPDPAQPPPVDLTGTEL
jgi:hypothetical protein